MSTEMFFRYADYSPSVSEMLPPAPLEEVDEDTRWLDYCQTASTLNRLDILQVVLSDLDSENSPILDLIDSALQEPHDPGRPKESITVLAGIGKAILHLVAQAVDNQVGLRMAVEVPR